MLGTIAPAPIPVEIYFPSWPYSKDEPEINRADMLFRFKDIQSRAESIINKWMKNYEQIVPAFDFVFLGKNGSTTLLEYAIFDFGTGLGSISSKDLRCHVYGGRQI